MQGSDKRKLLIVLLFVIRTVYLSAAPDETLTISFIGDTMAHDVNFVIKNYAVVYENIKDILHSDDLTFSNLEAPVDEKRPYRTYPAFNIHREYVQAVIEGGIEVFSLANNHTLDQGVEGLYQTLGSLLLLRDSNNMEVYFSGIRGNTKKPFESVEIRKKGWRIGFIAVTQFLNTARSSPYVHMVNYYVKSQADAFLAFIRKESVKYDLFIVSFHAGIEYKLLPDKVKADYFRQCIDAGAHIVFGHHPHVLQPYEIVGTGNRKRLIMYSMGNFISGQRWCRKPFEPEHYRSYTGDSLILTVDVTFGRDGASVETVTPVLITNHINENREVVVETFENIIRKKLVPEWSDYYNKRYTIMKKLVATYGSLRYESSGK
ncbi:MAG: CapA family protein [Spirochaetales bacterium]|nr:CapA family protein [Spirochaetales bacterium]